jgi:type 1 glutamine amidotransferase
MRSSLIALLLVACGSAGPAAPPIRVLFFTKETLYFHEDAHRVGDETVPAFLHSRGHTVTVTADAGVFAPMGLASFDVALFFVTSGVVLDAAQRAAFEVFIREGHGFVGIHSASATEVDSQFFVGLVGAEFLGHGAGVSQITRANAIVGDPADSIVAPLPSPWPWTDEWYYFLDDPAKNPSLHELLRVDETTLPVDYPSVGRTGDHPIAWRQEYAGARSVYIAQGHVGAAYTDPAFLAFIDRAVRYAANR